MSGATCGEEPRISLRSSGLRLLPRGSCHLRLERMHRMPGQAFQRRRPRLVFAADPAAITDRIEMTEQEGVVDLAGARLMTAGIVGELDMGNARKMPLDGAGEIALH